MNLSRASSANDRIHRVVLWLACLALVIVTAIAYWDSLEGPFVFDDQFAIVENPTIRQLRPISTVVTPPSAHGETVGGRPIVNLTLAVNYAFGGLNVRGYHVLNVLIHLTAGLVLFRLVRQTLVSLRLPYRKTGITVEMGVEPIDTIVAFAVAGIWLVHPLQTESVTYIVQRAESLVSLFYLLTLYAVARSSDGSRWWQLLAVIACGIGMATKEVMATVPIVALLYDRTFVAGSFHAAWRVRRSLYVGLAMTWLLLGALVWSTHGRGGSAGFTNASDDAWRYAMSQPVAILHYLRLALWPDALTFDYGSSTAADGPVMLLAATILVIALLVVVVAIRRSSALGFTAATFLVVLAPSSSVVPIATQAIAEHRVYLALALPIAAVVVCGHLLVGRSALVACGCIMVFNLALTARRNEIYHTRVALWSDTVAKQPRNARAQANLGVAYLEAGKLAEAMVHDELSLQLEPTSVEAHNNLANALVAAHRVVDALPHYASALRYRPDDVDAHYNFGRALAEVGRVEEAIQHYDTALALRPNFVAAHNNIGRLLALTHRGAEAELHYRTALRLEATYLPAWVNLGNLLVREDRPHEALPCYDAALKIDGASAEAHLGAAQALNDLGRTNEALPHLEAAVLTRPNDPDIHDALADALAHAGRMPEAESHRATADHLRGTAKTNSSPGH
jgi:protein O-mannosyl-transferase